METAQAATTSSGPNFIFKIMDKSVLFSPECACCVCSSLRCGSQLIYPFPGPLLLPRSVLDLELALTVLYEPIRDYVPGRPQGKWSDGV
jgi:hypothetical protein